MAEADSVGAVEYPPRATHVAHAWISAPCYRLLELEAEARRLHPDALAAKIISAAVLGDEVSPLVDT